MTYFGNMSFFPKPENPKKPKVSPHILKQQKHNNEPYNNHNKYTTNQQQHFSKFWARCWQSKKNEISSRNVIFENGESAKNDIFWEYVIFPKAKPKIKEK